MSRIHPGSGYSTLSKLRRPPARHWWRETVASKQKNCGRVAKLRSPPGELPLPLTKADAADSPDRCKAPALTESPSMKDEDQSKRRNKPGVRAIQQRVADW